MSFFDLKVLIFPLVIVVLFFFLLIRIYKSILGESVKFEILLALTGFYFLSYGHVKAFWIRTGPTGNVLALLFWVVTATALFSMIVFLVKNVNRISFFLNTISLFLIVLVVLEMVLFRITNKTPQFINFDGTSILGTTSTKEVEGPSVYYIILDGYGRSDVLKSIYDFDNSYFIDRLKGMGFYVAEKSKSNYNSTALSLPTSLNYNYIQDLFVDLDENSSDRGPLHKLIKNSKVAEFLKGEGYCVEYISSGYYGTEVRDVNRSISEHLALGEFESAVVGMTPIPSILQVAALKRSNITADIHRKTLLSAFDRIEETTAKTGCFIFAHILLPHPPFVFGRHGEEVEFYKSLNGWDGSHLINRGVTKDEYISYYRDQAGFATDKILEVIEKIISETSSPPVIILQSDHGPGSMLDWEDYTNSNLDERFGIINAYLLPDRNYEGFYQEVTPVNSFRLVFNNLFGSGFPMLEDKSFFSSYSHPYLFTDITGLLSQ